VTAKTNAQPSGPLVLAYVTVSASHLAFVRDRRDSTAKTDGGTGPNHPPKGQSSMIFGAHVIVYSQNEDGDRAFLKDVLGFSSVDVGHGWLIFALPPAEVAVHPAAENDRHELYLMCDDLKAEIAALESKGVRCSNVVEERWGSITRIRLPGGGQVGLYQPKHALAIKV
jgi:hypothetical protein